MDGVTTSPTSGMTMSTVTTFSCPSCNKVGSSDRTIPDGAKVRCKCGHTWKYGTGVSDIYEPEPVVLPRTSAPSASTSPVVTPATSAPTTTTTRAVATSKEPLYFRALEWMAGLIMVGGAGQLIYTLIKIIQREGESAPTFEGPMAEFKAKMSESANQLSAAVDRWVIAGSIGTLVACVTTGLVIWVVVDIARSLRSRAL